MTKKVNFKYGDCSKNVSHDEEVRKLYEEMENQIRLEKERIIAEVCIHYLSLSLHFKPKMILIT